MKIVLQIILAALLATTSIGQTVADSQTKAESKYPELTKPGSPIQARFALLQADAKLNNSKLFSNPMWPEYLADKAAKTLIEPPDVGWAYRTKEGDAKYNLGINIKQSPDPSNAKSLTVRVQNESERIIEYKIRVTFRDGTKQEETVKLPPPGQNIYGSQFWKKDIQQFEVLSANFTSPATK